MKKPFGSPGEVALPPALEASSEEDWPDGWHKPAPREAKSLLKELGREVRPGHRLYGKSAAVVARRYDRDDTLFYVKSPDYLLAQVHLTWSKETDSEWPHTETFQSLAEWLEARSGDLH